MITDDHFLWVERYRPRTVKECILPEELKKPFQSYVDSGQIPNLVLTGRPGTGKTTVARAMCEEIGADYIIINASDDRGIDTLRTIVKGFASTVSLTGGRKVIILDEADNLTQDAQKAYRGAIEEFMGNCSFIYTCNHFERLSDALHSRFAIIHFTIKEENKLKLGGEFFKRVVEILRKEEITFDKNVIVDVVKKYFPDYRRTLNELQHYAAGGTIDVGILAKVKDTAYTDLFGFIKAKNYALIRKWVGTHSDGDVIELMRGVYDRLNDHLESNSIPIAIILLGKYQYQNAFAIDKEINLMAFLTEVLIECQFK